MNFSRKRCSSGSEGDERCTKMDERKRKRMLSNRESAKRSRMRKQMHIKDLNDQINNFKNNCNKIVQEIRTVEKTYAAVETENQILRAQLVELRNNLESLEIILSYVRGVSGCSVDISQDLLLKPWQVLGQSMPLMASPGMLLS